MKIRNKKTGEIREFDCTLINSSKLSAQNRQRLYWCGKRNPDGTYHRVDVPQPEDRGILLKDILETGTALREKAYPVLTTHRSATAQDAFERAQRNVVAEPVNVTTDGKAQCQRATYYKDGIRNMVGNTIDRKTCVAEPVRIGTIESEAKNADFDSQQYRVYSTDGKSGTLDRPIYRVEGGYITIKGKQYPIKLADGCYIIRKLTVTECKRLQTVPESYEFPVSDTQAYKMLGNGWTVDVIVHILSYFHGIATEPLDVLSMYDGMACGHIALDKMGATIKRYRATEIDKYAIKTACHNFPDIVQLGDAFDVRKEDWSL